jgi:hypothetical protein
MKLDSPSWLFYRSHFGGNPCAECLTCGQIYVYWETDDLEQCENCDSGNTATHTVITLNGETQICEACHND